jgi:hypothetical protein
MSCKGAIFLGSVLLMLAASGRAQDVRQDIKVTPLGAVKTIGTFQRAEWIVDLGHTPGNPFDPRDIAVDATFTAPSGKKLIVPAFWDSPEGENRAMARPGFVVRFAPSEPGEWSFDVAVVEAVGRRVSGSWTFHVDAVKSRGFIRRAANNRYFQFDSGESYFPVGMNVCWASSDAARAQWYDETFSTLGSNGANFARVWMCHPPVMLESPTTGLGRYSLSNALFFDRLLASAQEHGIGVMLCMMNHRELLDHDMWGTGGWGTLPYNASNGGPATRPIDFFTNPDARREFKARLRYVVARYSAFTSLAMWEIFNEQEFARVDVPVEWNAEMSSYLRQIDPVKHLITTSANISAEVRALPDIDLTQAHIYGDGSQTDMVTPVANSASETEEFNKPHLVGEIGLDSKNPDSKLDPKGKGTGFHNGLWAGMLGGNAGSGMYWSWDNYVGPKDLWHEFKPVSQFASGVDWAGKNFKPVTVDQLWNADTKPGRIDLIILPAGNWGATAKHTIFIPINGRPGVSIPRYLYAPKQTTLHSPMVFDIDLAAATDMVLNVAQVSDYDVVRISIDDKPVRDLEFSALPGTPGLEKTEYSKEHSLYQGDLNKKFSLPVPAGHHKIKIDPIAGDWITLSQITFSGALDAKYADLAGFALQDAPSLETLVWVLNTKSNWKDDQSQEAPAAQNGIQLTVPNIQTGSFNAQWSDTRTGRMIRTDDVNAADGKLTLSVPTFNRDIALRLQPLGGKS